MKNITIIILVVVALFGGFVLGKSSQNNAVSSNEMQESMNDMMSNLTGKNGDEFDKAFITEMIVHHEGAVMMAQAAQENAKHEEIKNMARDIITAQSKEINQMKDWLKSWYGIHATSSAMQGMKH